MTYRRTSHEAVFSIAEVLVSVLVLASVAACSSGPVAEPPSIIDPDLDEQGVRRALGVPPNAERVLILSQSSHLDINWTSTFDEYYEDFVADIFDAAIAVLDAQPDSFYSVAEMGFLAEHLARNPSEPWRTHAASGHLRIVGGGMTSPDTLLPTAEALVRDYLYGTRFAEDELGARTRSAWLPDSFGHSPTVPDLLAAAGLSSVGFGRADGARHTFEIDIDGLEPIAPGVVTTASVLRDIGSSDFVWRGPGGGEVLAHYMPFGLYCQGDTIDLDGFALFGGRLGVDESDNPEFVTGRIAEYIADLTPYQRTPYLFVPVGCDFQLPRPSLAQYARWWNESMFEQTGLWVALATFEDYMRLVSFHRDDLPVMERDITPVWTGFYSSRPQVKREARSVTESLAGVEPFLALVDPTSDALSSAWDTAVLANHHDWITGTANDAVFVDEQLPLLEAARSEADSVWQSVVADLTAEVDTQSAADSDVVVVFNPGPVDRSDVVEVALSGAGPFRAASGGATFPAQIATAGRVAFLADAVPAYGWRTFSLQAGSVPGATATVGADSASLYTGTLDAQFTRTAAGWSLTSLEVTGEQLLAGASMEWVVYSDTGGLYRIGSERADCQTDEFVEISTTRFTDLVVIESGPARVTLRGMAVVDGQPTVVDFIAVAGGDRLAVRVTGSAQRDRTVNLRVQPLLPGSDITMGVAGGVAVRPLAHLYDPSLWPAVTWVSRGQLAVHLAQSTGVYGTASGALEWVAFRNAFSEGGCDNVGPNGTADGELTLEFSLGRRDIASAGAVELAASISLSRPLTAAITTRHAGDQPSDGRLISVEGQGVVATALKPATRGDGLVLHLLRLGAGTTDVTVRRGLLPWDVVTRPDLLERDDVPFGTPTADGVTVSLDAALTALRLAPE